MYQLLTYFSIPFVLLRLLWRSRQVKAYRQNWGERFGYYKSPTCQHVIWIHAVSMGETIAAKPLIEALRRAWPNQPLLITCMTPSGRQCAQRMLESNAIYQSYAPYDIGFSIKRFLRTWQPKLLVLIETELWPNLIHITHQHKIPILVANARLSKRSAKGYARAYPLTQHLFSKFYVAAQSRADGKRFQCLGVPKTHITVTQNLKYDAQIPNNIYPKAQELRATLQHKILWVAASTHSGEEEHLLHTLCELKPQHPDLLLWLVPRHPERSTFLTNLIAQQQLSWARRTALQSEYQAHTDVVVGDTMGEMMLFYAMADLVFVGGSLIEHGGHNYLEPAMLKCPMLTGPSTYNFSDIYRQLNKAKGIVTITPKTMKSALHRLICNPEEQSKLGHAAFHVAQQHKGATKQHIQVMIDQKWLSAPTND